MKTFISGVSCTRADWCRVRCHQAGASIRTSAMVTGWADATALTSRLAAGRERIDARAVVLSYGRPRTPPAGAHDPRRPVCRVYTTGHLQNAVHLKHRQVGSRAVVVGAELVSYSAVLTLKHAGRRTVPMTTEYPSPESYAMFNLAGRTPLLDVDTRPPRA